MNTIRRLTTMLRNEYHSEGVDIGNFAENPFEQCADWMEYAFTSNVREPNAVHLATADASGIPSGRIVLLRDFSERGFAFFTDYGSRKGEELNQNNHAAMTFFWSELYRQVRIGGKVYRLSDSESDAYFKSRPRHSQISALASRQSRVLESREMLERISEELEERYRDKPVPRPENWGGFYLSPDYIEFWQGREHRLHDRINYIRTNGQGKWTIRLLYP
jgi:pyridoxamine 5'-phosphate oxidase